MSLLNNIKNIINENLIGNLTKNDKNDKNDKIKKHKDPFSKIDVSKITTKDVVGQTVYCSKIVNNLLETSNIVVQNKIFCGFSDTDSQQIKKLNDIENSCFFSKNKLLD